MSNLNQSVLDAAMHSVGLEKTNNKNDITVLENNTVRVLGNYKKTVEVDKEKHKVRVTEHKTGEFTDMDTLTNTKKTEMTTKFNSSKDAITTAVRNNVNELKTSATGTINAIIAMQDAIGADSLINTTVAKSIAVGNIDGILIGEEIIKKDEFVLGLPDGCIFAVNYMEGDITDVINDNSPNGIESVKAYTGTGTFDNVDDSLCGQMVIGEGCWFGIGSENMTYNSTRLSSVFASISIVCDQPSQYNEKTINILPDILLNGKLFTYTYRYRQSRYIYSSDMPWRVKSMDNYFEFNTPGYAEPSISKNCLNTARASEYIDMGIIKSVEYTYSKEYAVGLRHITFRPWDRATIMHLRHDSDGYPSFNNIYNSQFEFINFNTPFILNKRKQTEITYQDILEEV